MMDSLVLFLAISTLISFSSCEKVEEMSTYVYSQTKCQDAWHSDALLKSSLEKRVKKYLKGEGIKVYDFFTVDATESFVSCMICECATGTQLHIKVDILDTELLETLGWRKLN